MSQFKSLLGINEVIADSAEICNIDLTDTVITGLTTTNVAEGLNLYFTDTRVNNNSNVSSNTTHRELTNNPHTVSASQVGIDSTDDITEGLTNLYYTDARFDTRFELKTTADLTEETNLYYTDARFEAGFDSRLLSKSTDDVKEGLTNLYYTDDRFEAGFDSRLLSKSTDDVKEGISNLYYTNIRFDSRLLSKTTDDVKEGLSNLYYTTARVNTDFDARLAIKSTTDLSEGLTNLYYTTARVNTDFDARLAIKSTTDLSEGLTNLYYTTARVNTDFDARLAIKLTDDVKEGLTNLYYTDTRVSANTDVSANTAYRGVGHLPLAGGTLTGDLIVDGSTTTDKLTLYSDSVPLVQPVMTSTTTPAPWSASSTVGQGITTSDPIGALDDNDATQFSGFGYRDNTHGLGSFRGYNPADNNGVVLETITDLGTRKGHWVQLNTPHAVNLQTVRATTVNNSQKMRAYLVCVSNDETNWTEVLSVFSGETNGTTFTNLNTHPASIHFRFILMGTGGDTVCRVNDIYFTFASIPLRFDIITPSVTTDTSYDLILFEELPSASSFVKLDETGKLSTITVDYLSLTGGTMTGDLDMNSNNISNIINLNGTSVNNYMTINSNDLDALKDVIITTPATNDILVYSTLSSTWDNISYNSLFDTAFDTRLDIKSTTDLSEGTNQYYTDTRVNNNSNVSANTAHRGLTNNPHSVSAAQVGINSTNDVKEGLTNLYYTEARVSANTNVAANTAYRNKDHLPLTGGTLTGALDIKIGNRSGTHGVNKGLYASADIGENSNGFEFRHSNGSQGVGIGFAGIYAAGSNINQNLHIKAKGTGTTILWSNLTMQNHNITGVGTINGYSLYSFNEAINLNTAKISYPTADSKKVGFISVSQAVNLDTMESNITTNNAKISYPAADSTKVGFISVTQAVNLDTMESNISTNNAKITYPTADSKKVGFISVSQAVDLDTMESNITTNNAKISYPTADSKKVGFISVTQAVNLDTMESNISTNNAKVSYPAADSTKVGFISVTQAVNLDTMESNISTNNAKVSADGSISTHSDVALVNPQLNDILIYSTISQDWGNGSFSGLFDTNFGGKSTTNLSEGTNQYYTDARVSNNTDVKTNTAKVSASGSIDTHSDVKITTPANGQVLTYNTGVWANATPAAVDLSGYLPINGTTAMTDNLNMGNRDIDNVNQVFIDRKGLANNKLVLFDGGVVSTSNFYGLGIQSYVLMYNIPGTTTNHKFYYDGTNELFRIGHAGINAYRTLNVTGDITVSGNVQGYAKSTDVSSNYHAKANHVIPSSNNVYDLGATPGGNYKLFRNLYLGGHASIYDYLMIGGTGGSLYAPYLGATKGLQIRAVNGNIAGPHVQYMTDTDFYPLFQQLNWSHDNINLLFDAYYDGAWRSSDAGSNFRIAKNGDILSITSNSGTAAGGAITWKNLLTIPTNGAMTYYNSFDVKIGSLTISLGTPTGMPGFVVSDASRRFDHFLQDNYYRMCFNYNNQGVKLIQGATSWVSASDRRYKKDIEEIKDCCAGLAQIKPYKFFYIENDEDRKLKRIGLMSQEVEAVYPELVETLKETTQAGEEREVKNLDYTHIIPILVGAVQELMKSNMELKAETAELKNRLDIFEIV